MPKRIYVGAVIVIISLFVTFFAPVDEVFRGVASIPAIGALCFALFQLVRDQALHEKNLDIQAKQNVFNFGAASHMANVVFDKQVEFSDKYSQELVSIMSELNWDGPSEKSITSANDLYKIRSEYVAWINDDIEKKLIPLESVIREIGALEVYKGRIEGDAEREQAHSDVVDKIHDLYVNVLEIDPNSPKDKEATLTSVISSIRNILGVNEVIRIREYIIREASRAAQIQ